MGLVNNQSTRLTLTRLNSHPTSLYKTQKIAWSLSSLKCWNPSYPYRSPGLPMHLSVIHASFKAKQPLAGLLPPPTHASSEAKSPLIRRPWHLWGPATPYRASLTPLRHMTFRQVSSPPLRSRDHSQTSLPPPNVVMSSSSSFSNYGIFLLLSCHPPHDVS